MICMIKLFNEMEIFGAKINRENRVDMVLETLLNSFGQFKLNYAMNKLVISLLELMRELQTGMRVFK